MPIDPAAISRLPTLPAVAVKLLQHFSNPDVSLAAVGEILRPDPALTARIMKAACSVEFGIGKPLADVRRAVQMLGLRRVTSLALSFLLSEPATKPTPIGAAYREAWLRSLIEAVAMESLATRRARGSEAEHYTIGLLLEIGELAVLQAAPAEALSVHELVRKDPDRRDVIEQESFGCTVADVSVALFRQWRLPTQFSEAVRCRRGAMADLSSDVTAAHRAAVDGAALATSVADYFCCGNASTALLRMHELAHDLYRMEIGEVGHLLNQVHAKVRAGAELFNVDVSRLADPSVLMDQALEQLAAILERMNEAVAAESHSSSPIHTEPQFVERATAILASRQIAV